MAVANYVAYTEGGTNKAITTMNLVGNAISMWQFINALSNRDAEKTMWKVQSVLGAIMCYVAGKAYLDLGY